MRRRDVILGIGGLISAPIAARAHQKAMPVIGVFSTASPGPYAKQLDGFRRGLSENGFVEGKNVAIEYRWAEGSYERLPAMAADLVSRQVAVIGAMTLPSALAAKSATSIIPIVFYIGLDPVQYGFVESFARPGGNMTGISSFNNRLNPKRLEILHELLSEATVLGFLVNPANANAEPQSADAKEAVLTLGRQLIIAKASNERELDRAFATLAEQQVRGLVAAADPFFTNRRDHIVALAAQYLIPTVYVDQLFVTVGGLISYGNSLVDEWYQVGLYAGRILKGDKPADLPVVQPTKFELVINLKTAKALGLTVPPLLLATADEVIE
jgi:putative ABC transport system substrate-binding protein